MPLTGEQKKVYQREYMRKKRMGLTAGSNKDLNVGVRGLEPPTSASQTLRASQLRHTPLPRTNIADHLLRVKRVCRSGLQSLQSGQTSNASGARPAFLAIYFNCSSGAQYPPHLLHFFSLNSIVT
jgi:hypothetical protein